MKNLETKVLWRSFFLSILLLMVCNTAYTQKRPTKKQPINNIQKEYNSYIDKGDSLFKASNYVEAIIKYKLCFDLPPYKNDRHANFQINKSVECICYTKEAMELLKQDNIGEAIVRWTDLCKVNPDDQVLKSKICSHVLDNAVKYYENREYEQTLKGIQESNVLQCSSPKLQMLIDSCNYYNDRYKTGFNENEVDQKPMFDKTGMDGYKNFILKNVNRKKIRQSGQTSPKDKGTVTVTVKFQVDITGQVRNPEIRKAAGLPFLNDEAIRLFNIMPHWIPGIKKGEKVPVILVYPVAFTLN